MNDLLETFFQECDDLLEGLSAGLGDLENETGDGETVNAMFRSVHSIKGGAGAFGLDQLVGFSHAFENVLDDIRSGRLKAGETVVALLFSAADHLTDLVEAARNGAEIGADHGASILSDLKLMSRSVNPGGGDAAHDAAPDFEPLALDFGADLPPLDALDLEGDAALALPGPGGAAPVAGGFAIRFRPSETLYTTGNDPALLLRTLAELGEIEVSANRDGLTPLGDDWYSPRLGWDITIRPDDGIDETAIRDVFEFVEGACTLEIAPSASSRPDLPLPDLPSLDVLPPVDDGAPGTSALEPGPDTDQSHPAPAIVTAAKDQAKPQPARASTIRVDLQRVDRLINLVGELVIGEAMLRQSMQQAATGTNSAIDEAMNQLKQLSGMIQESVMAIRAQPVRSLFQRMSRIVRESAREAGKQARLVTLGDATEVDKTVTERLVDPLTHMIRNAIDHGLEPPDARRAAGKSERGTVTLAAAHRSGRVVITLSDDGAGIDRPQVRRIAEQKGLIRPEDDLSDAEIDNLLFRPGFSTAKQVSNLSGRGVGMDVVRSEIQALGGRVGLQSTPGAGTTLTISLPLTLAVLEGMVVIVENEALVVPTLALRETLQPNQAALHALCDQDVVLRTGDGLVPVIDLGAQLGFRPTPQVLSDRALLLIESEAGKRTALAVDRIVDQREVVIKGLEQNYRAIPGIAAATILGDGNIALIVDTEQVVAPQSLTAPRGAATTDIQGAA